MTRRSNPRLSRGSWSGFSAACCALALASPGTARADAPAPASTSTPAAPPTAAPAGTPAAPATAPAVPGTAPVPGAAPAAGTAPVVEKAAPKLDRVPRVVGLSVGWAWNTVDKLPVSLDGKKQQPHGLNVFSDFLWQVGGLAGGWPSWLGFMAGFLYFPGQADVRRETMAIEYGILVRHTVLPFSIVRPILSYGLGAVQVFVPGVEERAIGHLTRLSIGADVVLNPSASLSFEVMYKIQNIPTFGPPAGTGESRDFHTFGALAGAHYGF